MENMNELVDKAINGDKLALEKVIDSIKDSIYNLSLRMLWNPDDTEDVAQEIIRGCLAATAPSFICDDQYGKM